MKSGVELDLSPGTIFADRYRVVRCMRSGGMGALYETVHLETARKCALKVMLPSLVSDPVSRGRFRLEATVAANIGSEHIVEVFDAGIDAASGAPYLVMELLRGEDLGTILRAGPLAAAELHTLLYQASLALEKTHAAGVVHRDLKPDNLFLTERDDGSPRLKILDFGIAKVIAKDLESAQRTATIGTPLYMAPEQIHGGAIGPAADLYALGQIAYAMVTGAAYWGDGWEGGAIYKLLMDVANGVREPASVRAARVGVHLPPAFDPWFAKAAALEPEQRFDSARVMVQALAQVFELTVPNATRRGSEHSSGAHASGAHPSDAHASGAHASGAHPSDAHASGAHASGAHEAGRADAWDDAGPQHGTAPLGAHPGATAAASGPHPASRDGAAAPACPSGEVMPVSSGEYVVNAETVVPEWPVARDSDGGAARDRSSSSRRAGISAPQGTSPFGELTGDAEESTALMRSGDRLFSGDPEATALLESGERGGPAVAAQWAGVSSGSRAESSGERGGPAVAAQWAGVSSGSLAGASAQRGGPAVAAQGHVHASQLGAQLAAAPWAVAQRADPLRPPTPSVAVTSAPWGPAPRRSLAGVVASAVLTGLGLAALVVYLAWPNGAGDVGGNEGRTPSHASEPPMTGDAAVVGQAPAPITDEDAGSGVAASATSAEASDRGDAETPATAVSARDFDAAAAAASGTPSKGAPAPGTRRAGGRKPWRGGSPDPVGTSFY